jgi:DNA replication protein DnaC
MKKVKRQELESRVLSLCKELKLPAVARDAARLATEATRQGTHPLTYLVELLETELSERIERRAKRRTREASFPVVKTLEGFDFKRAPHLPETLLRQLASGEYIERAEPIIFVGEPGTGKTHLASALGEAAARQGRRVKFTTAAGLVTELVEARDAMELGRVVRRYSKVSLLILDELAYLPLARSDAELLFRVLGERTERLPVIITTNLPFSEWTTMFPDPRLCRAILDRLTHRAHIIETGKNSIRLEDALTRQSRRTKSSKKKRTKRDDEGES